MVVLAKDALTDDWNIINFQPVNTPGYSPETVPSMNRKQRRAQNTKSSKADAEPDIPLALPPENDARKAKTLYEIAAERQATLTADAQGFGKVPNADNVVNVAVGPNGEIRPLDGATLPVQSTEDLEPWVDSLMLASSLSALHFTLEALTVHQYADELRWMPIFWHTVLQAFPILTLMVHFAHGHIVSVKLAKRGSSIAHVIKQIVFVGIANMAGCYLVYLTNDKGYMAVMKNAPSIGTVWVWAVIELGLAGALAGVVGPGVYAWYYGYGIF